MDCKIVVAVLISALVLSGCTNNSGMTPPRVCNNTCLLWETQGAYPDCTCGVHSSGSQITGVGSYTPIGSGTGSNFQSNRSSYSYPSYLNAPASQRDTSGMIIVLVAGRNANATYTTPQFTASNFSVYLHGSGAGWVYSSSAPVNVSLDNETRDMLFSVRPWTGKYLLLKMNISNVSISVARTSYYTERINASGSHEYAFVIGLPVDASQTSAIELLFDINRSFVYTNGSLEFSPVVEVRSIDHVQYIRATDTVQLTNGTLELAEEARFNQSGASAWTVLGGANAICTQTCVQLCPDRSSPDCHYHCASSCSKEPDYTRTMCDGGVAFNTCAPSKPFRCLNGTYIADCATCGCDENQECNSNGVCGTTAQIGTDVP